MSASRSPAVRPLAQDAREKHARHSRADLTAVVPFAISFSLAVRHLEALQGTIDRDPDSFPNTGG